MSRAHISLETKLAAALLALGHIPYEHAKLMTARQITSLYQFDHYPIRKDDNGPDEPWNIAPRLILAHRLKTSKFDRPQLAKADRLSDAQIAFRERLLATNPQLKSAYRFPKGRKLQSRPFPSRPRAQGGGR